MDERFELIQAWLPQLPRFAESELVDLAPASADASFRRYFRVRDAQSNETYIIMDAPPTHEDCRPFIKVSQDLSSIGVPVPEVLEQDLAQGFLLLTDLGNTTLMRFIAAADESAVDQAYRESLRVLAKLNAGSKNLQSSLPAYDDKLLNVEMSLFSDWLMADHLKMPMNHLQSIEWQKVNELLTRSALSQPKTYVHRDYHSRNLMVQPEGSIGVLDFQDAVAGPLNYDAVSLIRDCYVAWPVEQVAEWQRFYFLELKSHGLVVDADWHEFQKSMDLMGVQRHLKAAGIFCRLFHRDGKDGYLDDVPQTLQYIVQIASQYNDLSSLAKMVETQVIPNWSREGNA